MSFARAVALLTLLALAGPAIARDEPQQEKDRLAREAEERAEVSLRARQKAWAEEVEALQYLANVLDRGEDRAVRKQSALAVKALSSLNSWKAVLQLRTCADDEDKEVKAAVRSALATVKPPDNSSGLVEIVTNEMKGDDPSPVFVLAYDELAKTFPDEPSTRWALRAVLAADRRHVSKAARTVAAKALDTLPVEKPAK